MNLYFIGINDYILQCNNPFKGSITVVRKFSETKNNICYNDLYPTKKVDYNNLKDLKKIDQFFIAAVKKVLATDKNAYFIRYNEHNLKGYNLKKYHILEMNKYDLYNTVNDKFFIREKLKNSVNVLHYDYIKGFKLKKVLQKRFLNFNSGFVAQEKYGFAGCNTFIINKSNLIEQCKKLKKFTTYAVSILQEKTIPLNIHAFIDIDEIKYYKPSRQIINTNKDQMNYDGASFDINEDLENNIKKCSKPIAEFLKGLGYKGVFGIDYILVDKTIYLMEINARFQTSTYALNKILSEKNQPTLFDKQINLLSKLNGKIFELN